ncbi:MAG: class I SAM-dependent methyltransferase [Dokdonella sp.]
MKHPNPDPQQIQLPPEFDSGFYRRNYADIRGLGDEELEYHFRHFGIAEGRCGSKASTRQGFVELIAEVPSVLEIGPLANPVLRGEQVKYFDVLPTAELREKAAGYGLNADDCPEIHFSSPTGDLDVIDGQFDAVLSSHAIEHQPDLIHHLSQVGKRLHPGGCYYLMIPDKRYCFDHFLPESSIADVLSSHLRGLRLHDPAKVINHFALTTHNDSTQHWLGEHGRPGYQEVFGRLRGALRAFDAAAGGYIDVHAWQFTPASFRDICSAIFQLGLVELEPVRVYQTVFSANEFCAVLQKQDPDAFDAAAYLAANPDVAAAGVDARHHYLDHGRHEGRKLFPTP